MGVGCSEINHLIGTGIGTGGGTPFAHIIEVLVRACQKGKDVVALQFIRTWTHLPAKPLASKAIPWYEGSERALA